MILRRILPLAAAVLLAGCSADPTHSSPPSEPASREGVNMGGSGGYTAPGAPRMDGSQMGGSGGYTGGSGTPVPTSSTGSLPGDSTTLAERGSQMGGSGG